MLSYLNRVPSVFACFSHYSRAFAWSVLSHLPVHVAAGLLWDF